MPLVKRTDKGSPLSIEEMDGNLDYLATNLSGSTVTISGSVNLSGSLSVNGTQVGSSYKVYTALLTQTSTNAPTAEVLENTLGADIVWSRSQAGYYIGTLAGAFIAGKTLVGPTGEPASSKNLAYPIINSAFGGPGSLYGYLSFGRLDNDSVYLLSTDATSEIAELSSIYQGSIQVNIKVYN